MSAGSFRNPLHVILDLLILYHRAGLKVSNATTNEARQEAQEEWRSLHSAVWGNNSSRNDTIRLLADPAKAWLTKVNSRYVELRDFNVVEECAYALSSFAINPAPMAMPDVYSKAYNTEEELWRLWTEQGDRITAIGNLIAKLKELAARAGHEWMPANTVRQNSGDSSSNEASPVGDSEAVIQQFLWKSACAATLTADFRGRGHDALLEILRTKADAELPGRPRITTTQSLQDAGCDIVIEWRAEAKFGIQLKSHFDIGESAFAAKTVSQIQNSRQHGLRCLYVLLAGDLTDRSQEQKVRGFEANISKMNDPYVCTIAPERVWTLLLDGGGTGVEESSQDFGSLKPHS